MLSNREMVATKLQRIAEKARRESGCRFTSLFHLMNVEMLRECFRQLRKDAAAGIDKVIGDIHGMFDPMKRLLKLEALGKQTTWQMYRRKLKVLNRNKLIVFVGSHFGIFPSHEVFILADVPVRKTAIELDINRTQIYSKYTGMLPADN